MSNENFYTIIFFVSLLWLFPVSQLTAQSDTFSAEKEVFTVVEQMPEFPGGEVALAEYLKKQIKYPENALKSKIQGLVVINFIVEKDGSISHVNVINSVSTELDAEAIRVIQSMPRWKPGYQKGQPVRVSINLPIRFQI